MRFLRTKEFGVSATYHCMTRIVASEMLLKDREKEILRQMIWKVAEFCGMQVLTYCVMSNHFHVLLYVPEVGVVSDAELMRRYRVMYPKPTKFQTASAGVLESILRGGGEEAEVIRRKLLARMGDVSEYMKTLKQRFSVWYNRNHGRHGTLWAERFKSVLVEGRGNALQTVVAYIDLNPVRAGLVEDPKDYRFCGYAEAVVGDRLAGRGLVRVWRDRLGAHRGGEGLGSCDDSFDVAAAEGECALISGALRAHRMLIFGKGASPWTHKGKVITREQAIRVMEEEEGDLSVAAVLRCRVRYFSDGAILGSAEFVREFLAAWQSDGRRQYPSLVNELKGADWGGLSVVNRLRGKLFG